MNAAVMKETCPDVETLAAFSDGTLDAKSRLEVMQHIADCGDCRDLIVAVHEYEVDNEAQTGNVVRGPFGKRWIAPLSAAAVVVLLFGGMIGASQLEPGTRLEPLRRSARTLVHTFPVPVQELLIGKMEMLAEAAESLPERKTPARLSGDFSYKRHSPKRGGADTPPPPTQDVADLELAIAAGRAAERVENQRSATNLHALGVASILTENRKEAVHALEQAANANPSSAAILTDLAAAYLARGARGDYERALVLATKAWNIEHTPAAAWNRALAFELLGRDREAISAWQAYVKLDPNSGWGSEAKDRITRLQEYRQLRMRSDVTITPR